jgi:GNAT superfamily N-acetyltransferase
MTPVSPTPGVHVSILVDEDRPALLDLLKRDRVASVYLRSVVHEFGISPTDRMGHGRFFGASLKGRLLGVLFAGNARNFSTLGEVTALPVLLQRAMTGAANPRLFVGPAEHAPLIRSAFARAGASPFLDRAQAYYVLDPDRVVSADGTPIRPARLEELTEVAQAHAAMTEEDLEIPRTQLDMAKLREMSRARIEQGKVWVHMDEGRLLFKTEEAARSEDAVLVGGVYTDPSVRGQGYATRGIATWARRLFAGGLERMVLHVNANNAPAVGAYERVGFVRHSMLRLILAY